MNSIFIFLFLILFPFGQIIRIGILQPIDLVVGLAAIYSIVKKQKVPEFAKHLQGFLLFAGSSWILSIFIFHQIEVLYGLLYLLRLIAYSYFGIYVWNLIRKKFENKVLLINSLLSLSIISSLFGWIQFFNFPDLKPFFVWGWDMHLFRLAGTFLDPTFLGLIIVFGLILSMNQFIDTKKRGYIFVILFLLVSLAFTYSRASYLAFLFGLGVLLHLKKKLKYILLPILILGALIVFLPTSRNQSIDLFRSFSVFARLENYQTTLNLFSKSPVFGIGYDNMCIAYQKYIGAQDFSSHACSGSDSSLLFILATTGILGMMVFVYSIYKIAISLKRPSNFTILASSFLALLVHSLFSNSLFYPWIMGWMIILLALASSTR